MSYHHCKAECNWVKNSFARKEDLTKSQIIERHIHQVLSVNKSFHSQQRWLSCEYFIISLYKRFEIEFISGIVVVVVDIVFAPIFVWWLLTLFTQKWWNYLQELFFEDILLSWKKLFCLAFKSVYVYELKESPYALNYLFPRPKKSFKENIFNLNLIKSCHAAVYEVTEFFFNNKNLLSEIETWFSFSKFRAAHVMVKLLVVAVNSHSTEEDATFLSLPLRLLAGNSKLISCLFARRKFIVLKHHERYFRLT